MTNPLINPIFEEASPLVPAPANESNPLDNPEYTFSLKYTDARGKLWDGTFKIKIPTIGEQQAINQLHAQFNGGLPMTSLSPDANALNRAMAHMRVCLVERPAWAKDLSKLSDERLIFAIYTEVVAHYEHFFRLGETA